jgi:hypothetical protein
MSEKSIEIIFKRKYVFSGDTSLTSYTLCLADKQHRVAFKRNLTSKKIDVDRFGAYRSLLYER